MQMHRSRQSRVWRRKRRAMTHRGRRGRLRRAWLSEGGADPFRLAREFFAAENTDSHGRDTLRFWRGEWYRYLEGRYVRSEEGIIRVHLTAFIKSYFDDHRIVDQFGNVLRVGKALVSNTANALAAITAVPDETEIPAWLGSAAEGPFLATANGLLDIGHLPGGEIQVRDASPEWFSTVAFPVTYDPTAECPQWLKFLDEVMENDQERIALLQEWAGYLLTPDTTQHRFVVAEGEGANGKSVFLDVLTTLLGEHNVSHVPLEMFGVRFQLTATLQKLANICAEVGEIDKVAEGFLKQFTAGDRMYFDRKNISGVMAYPTARLVLSTNNRPRFRDRSAGLWRRMIVVPFRVTIPLEQQDHLLKEKLKEELPGIFLWAVEGLKRLRQNKRFTIPAICQETLEDYKQESNPSKVFLLETCRKDSRQSVHCQFLYNAYVEWAKASGFEVLDARQFGKEVRKVFPEVQRDRVSVGAVRQWIYRGLAHVPSSPMSFIPIDLDTGKLTA